jgi:hypothetical protein
LKHQDYQNTLTQSWGNSPNIEDAAKRITAKLKFLRKNLREWQASMQNLKTVIANVRIIILFLEVIADHRDLSLAEWNFHKILENTSLICWKNREFIGNKEAMLNGFNWGMQEHIFFSCKCNFEKQGETHQSAGI